MQNAIWLRVGMSLLCVSLALEVGSVAAIAQSGSTGGSIGNDEKSLSGSRSDPSSDREVPAPRNRETEQPLRSPGENDIQDANNFDGTWAYTGVGTNCRGSGSGLLVISGGLISSKNRGIGRVSPDGTYRSASVSADGVPLTATGRMSGNTGSGTYRRADGCNGRWTAKKL
jgi:hypothetical protein